MDDRNPAHRRRLPALARASGTAFRRFPDTATGGAFLCNALNPKEPIYFLALFTVVLSPGLPVPTLVAYGAAMARARRARL